MRRANREITDPSRFQSILDQSNICQLALIDGDYPYVLPLNFGYDYQEGMLTLYFHCAREGKKLDCIKKHNSAAFSVVGESRMVAGPLPCNCTMAYGSVMGQGKIEIIEGEGERLHAMKRLMDHCGWKGETPFNPQSLAAVCLLRLRAESVTGKHNDPKAQP